MHELNKELPQAGAATESSEKLHKKTFSRRLVLHGLSGMAGVLTGFAGSEYAHARDAAVPNTEAALLSTQEPMYGSHQSGISTAIQSSMFFVALDLTTRDLSSVKALFKQWTEAAADMAQGRLVGSGNDKQNLPPSDTGEAAGLPPSRLTFTFGVGASLFDARFGLGPQRPQALIDLPAFPGDDLDPARSGGDIGIQVCADDPQVAFHAARNLLRIARGTAVPRWMQQGFQPQAASETPRNLMGFKDGTVNPGGQNSQEMKEVVWVQPGEGPEWMSGGTYMVTRRINMFIEVWDRSTLNDQEVTFGRYKDSGAGMGHQLEFDALDFEKMDTQDSPAIPTISHVRLARGGDGEKIFRRPYSFSDGIEQRTGHLDAGLFFIAFQRNAATQFVPIQRRLAGVDALNEYIVHRSSALFACFPGIEEGKYVGESLFEA